jgi:hypothetical protein
MARPSKLTPARHELIVGLLRNGYPWATACRRAGVSTSAAYEWIDRGHGVHPSRPPTRACVAFAEAVDAVFPGGFAGRDSGDDSMAAGETGGTPEKGESPGAAEPEWESWERLRRRISAGAPEDPFADAEPPAQVAQPNARAREAQVGQPKKPDLRHHDLRQHETEVTAMELEATIRIPVAGATMTIPTRDRIFTPGVAGGRVMDSIHTADLGSLRTVELEDGVLKISLRSGEAYTFPIAELLDGEADPLLTVRETWAGHERAAYGGVVEKVRLHDLHLARVTSLRLVGPEPVQAPERWSERTGWAAGPRE